VSRRCQFGWIALALLALASAGVAMPMLAMYVDYRVAEATAAQARYDAQWLMALVRRADAIEPSSDLRDRLRSRVESENLKLAVAASALHRFNPDWRDDELKPSAGVLRALLAAVPSYWAHIVSELAAGDGGG